MAKQKTKQKKITVQLPEDLLLKASKTSGTGITETIRKGLQLLAASESYEELRKYRGKIPLPLDLKKLREDRR